MGSICVPLVVWNSWAAVHKHCSSRSRCRCSLLQPHADPAAPPILVPPFRSFCLCSYQSAHRHVPCNMHVAYAPSSTAVQLSLLSPLPRTLATVLRRARWWPRGADPRPRYARQQGRPQHLAQPRHSLHAVQPGVCVKGEGEREMRMGEEEVAVRKGWALQGRALHISHRPLPAPVNPATQRSIHLPLCPRSARATGCCST